MTDSNRPGSRTYCGSLDTARIAANCFDFRSNGGRPASDGFTYSSDSNSHWLAIDELRAMAHQPAAAVSGA